MLQCAKSHLVGFFVFMRHIRNVQCTLPLNLTKSIKKHAVGGPGEGALPDFYSRQVFPSTCFTCTIIPLTSHLQMFIEA